MKPANLIYSVEEIQPLGVTLLLAIQHLIIALVYLVYPVIVVTEAGGSLSQATFAVQFA